jgi:hypothetical protein
LLHRNLSNQTNTENPRLLALQAAEDIADWLEP